MRRVQCTCNCTCTYTVHVHVQYMIVYAMNMDSTRVCHVQALDYGLAVMMLSLLHADKKQTGLASRERSTLSEKADPLKKASGTVHVHF